MKGGLNAVFETPDGARLPGPPDAAKALGALLSSKEVRRWLVARGLQVEEEGEILRTRIDALRQVLGAVPAGLGDAPDAVRAHPAFDGDEPRRLVAALANLALASARDVVVVLREPETPPRLELVPPPEDPREVLARMSAVTHGEAGSLLRALEAVVGAIDLPHDLLMRTLIPLLSDPGTCAAAATLLGKAGVRDAVPALRQMLSRSASLEDRLSLLGALVRLGERELGLRTLRSMVAHGAPRVRRRAVRTLEDVAGPEDVASVSEMMRSAPDDARMHLAALAYALGDVRAYTVLARGLESLEATSEVAEARDALEAIARTRSQRFVPLLVAYLEREDRPWFVARARSVLSDLRHRGASEATPTRILELAEQAWYHNRRDEALELLDRVLTLEPTHAHALYLKANCLKEEGHADEALRISGLALAADPTSWRLHRLRGSLLWDSGKQEGALEAYDRALSYQPVDPYTWYYKGYVLYRLQRYEEALPCLDRSLSLKSDSPYIYNQKAFCLERLGRHEEAALCYRRSLKLNSEDFYTREYLGQALQAAGHLDQALACFDRVLGAQPEREDALYRRADVLYDLERWEASAAAFEAFLELRSDSYNAWFNRGLCLRFLARHEEAVACFGRALEIRPESESARRHYEYCLRR